MSWAVVRVRGSVNVNPKIKETMKLMKLSRVNHCVIIPENETYTGMLNIIKDYVTWGEIDSETTELLLESSGKSSGNSAFSKKHLKETTFKTMKALAKGLRRKFMASKAVSAPHCNCQIFIGQKNWKIEMKRRGIQS